MCPKSSLISVFPPVLPPPWLSHVLSHLHNRSSFLLNLSICCRPSSLFSINHLEWSQCDSASAAPLLKQLQWLFITPATRPKLLTPASWLLCDLISHNLFDLIPYYLPPWSPLTLVTLAFLLFPKYPELIPTSELLDPFPLLGLLFPELHDAVPFISSRSLWTRAASHPFTLLLPSYF